MLEDQEYIIKTVDELLYAYGLRTYTELCERLTELVEKLVGDAHNQKETAGVDTGWFDSGPRNLDGRG